MPEPINLMQDPEPTSIKMQRIMQDEERKRALAAGKDPNAGALFKNDFATPQLIELGRRYPQLLDPMAQAQVPDNIRVQAAELMALREAQERIQFQNLVANNVMTGTKPVEEPTYLARPGEAPSDAGAVSWRKIAEERAFRSQMASQVGESVMGMASAMAGAPSRMPRLQTAPTMMGVQKGQPMPPSEWNRPGSQMGTWWESLPTAAQQGMNVAGRQAKAEGRVPMVTPEGPISLTLPTPTRTTPKPTTTIEVADRTMPTVVRPTLPNLNRSTGITYWDPYNPTDFTQQLLRQDREKSGQSKGLSLATICSGIGATATAAPEIFRSVLAVDIDMRKAETAEKIGNKTTVQSLLDMSPDQLVDPQTNESVRVVQASLPCRSSSKANWQRTESSSKDTEMASKFVELVSGRVKSDGGPSVVMLENVPEYERSDAANVLRTQLQNLGYNWHEQVYNAAEHGSLQARRRWWGFAYKDGVEFTPPQKQQARPWIEAISDGVSRMPIEKDPRSIRSVITKGAEALRARGHDPKTYDNWVLLDGAHYNHQPNIRLANEPAMTIKAKENEIVRIWNPATNEIRRADGRFMARLFDVPDEISSKLADSPYGHIKTGFGDSIPFKMVQAVVGSLKLPDQFPSRTVSQPPVLKPIEPAENLNREQKAMRNPAFRKWFGESVVKDEKTGEPIVVYHGTARLGQRGTGLMDVMEEGVKYAVFDEFHGSPFGAFGPGIYTSTNPETASQYAGREYEPERANRVYPMYVKIQKPIEIDASALNRQDMAEHLALKHFDELLPIWKKQHIQERFPNISLDAVLSDNAKKMIAKVLADRYISLHEIVEQLQKIGFDGIKVVHNEDDTYWVPFSSEQLKSVNNPGTWGSKKPESIMGKIKMTRDRSDELA